MRHRFDKRTQLRGIRKAIRTLQKKRGGPKWLLPSMRRYEKRLATEVRQGV